MSVNRTLRNLKRDPAFTVTAVLTLTLGVAASTTIFSLVYAALLRPLPYHAPERIVVLWASIPKKGIPADWTSWPTIQDWRRLSNSFEDVATQLRIDSATLTGQDNPEEVKAGRVSANLFPVLGVSPLLGRTFTSAEENRRDPVVVISYQFWRGRFAGAASIIGKQIEVDHKKATVIGVMPQSFAFPSADTRLWLPLSFVPQWSAFLGARQSDGFRAIARLKPGVSLQEAQIELNTVAAHLGKQYPGTDAGKGIALVPLAKQMTDPRIRAALWTLFGAVVLMLLIGCGNVASLLLARGSTRTREFAIRAALGAAPSRLLAQMMWESAALALISGLLGSGAMMFVRRILPRLVPTDLISYSHSELSVPVLLFDLLLCAATLLIFGLAPAWQLSFAQPRNVLGGSSRAGIGKKSSTRLRSALIVGEFALAMVLLSGTGLLIHSFVLLERENLGFTPAGLLLGTINLPVSEAQATESRDIALEEILERVKQVPGVTSAALISGLISDYTPNTDVITEGSRGFSPSVQTTPCSRSVISATFFKTVSMPFEKGRPFSEDDRASSPPVAVINSSMAHQFWPGQDPIGKRFRFGSPGSIGAAWLTVIGIVGDMNPYGPGSRVIPTFYVPFSQALGPPALDLVVRCRTGNCNDLGNAVETAVRSGNRGIPKFAVQAVTGLLAQISAPRRFQIWLLGIFSGIALALAAMGIYGLLSYLVSLRSREISLRIALGATVRDVLRLILVWALKLAGLGIVLGVAASFLLMRLLQHLLYGVGPYDPLTIILVSVTLLGAAFVASYFPALVAIRLDPLVAIRQD